MNTNQPLNQYFKYLLNFTPPTLARALPFLVWPYLVWFASKQTPNPRFKSVTAAGNSVMMRPAWRRRDSFSLSFFLPFPLLNVMWYKTNAHKHTHTTGNTLAWVENVEFVLPRRPSRSCCQVIWFDLQSHLAGKQYRVRNRVLYLCVWRMYCMCVCVCVRRMSLLPDVRIVHVLLLSAEGAKCCTKLQKKKNGLGRSRRVLCGKYAV